MPDVDDDAPAAGQSWYGRNRIKVGVLALGVALFMMAVLIQIIRGV
jgi:hypothetical protein